MYFGITFHQLLFLRMMIDTFSRLCLQNKGHQLGFVTAAASSSAVPGWNLTWAVKLNLHTVDADYMDIAADIVANATGLFNLGQIGALHGYYHMIYVTNRDEISKPEVLYHLHSVVPRNADNKLENLDDISSQIEQRLHQHDFVEWHSRQKVVNRSRRSIPNRLPVYDVESKQRGKRNLHSSHSLVFNDPVFVKQWHLVNWENPGKDVNVSGVWMHNITGKGVTVAVIDDGLEWHNMDLMANYNANGSFDLNGGDDDPTPDSTKFSNHHGTRCAGEIAAVANNKICGVGVAFEAKVSGIRILDGPMTDVLEATAFTRKYDVNDVYSCSWGPEDDGKTVDGPQRVATDGMRHGVDYGRGGYGAIYVVASGNGGLRDDNCNYDGYANSVYTVTIGAVGENGHMPYYAEECASMLAVTYSSGDESQRSIVTTDWNQHHGVGCTENHSGTSAAAPLAAGLIALIIEARPCLTWRDVQYIIAITAVKIDLEGAEWTRNAAGLYHSHQHGFGLMNAWAMVNTAKVWRSVPWMTVFASGAIATNLPIPGIGSLRSNFTVTETMLSGYALNTLEYVHVIVSLSHVRRGDVQLVLICPSGTASIIGATRSHDDSTEGFSEWTFATVRCWGEEPIGEWILVITDMGDVINLTSRGMLVKWSLKLYGSAMRPHEVQERIGLVKEAASGKYLNASFQLDCPPPPLKSAVVLPVSEKLLKVLATTGVFLLLLAVYESFEYAFCYDEEKVQRVKEEQERRTAAAAAAEQNVRSDVNGSLLPTHVASSNVLVDSADEDECTESSRLLCREEIALSSFATTVGTADDTDDENGACSSV